MAQTHAQVTISSVRGREVLDSRGNPTVEAEVGLSNGISALATVPSGASTGAYEAVELRDGDRGRYLGRGVSRAVNNVNTIIGPSLQGQSPLDQASVDRSLIDLDGSPDKGNLGANAVLAVSLAVAKAGAALASGNSGSNGGKNSLWSYLSQGGEVTLPVPMFNILNGGRHASDSTDVQEFMVAPVGLPTFREALRAGVEIYHALRELLREQGHNLNVGDEGGFAPTLPSNSAAIDVILKAVESAGYAPGKDVFLTLDVAASEFYDAGKDRYVMEREGVTLRSDQLVELYSTWRRQYPIISIEDGLNEDDWEGWQELARQLGDSVQLVGDDLFVTNLERIRKGVDTRAGNAVLLKPNQIGTVTETYQAFKLARDTGWGTVMSHRSGETEDTTIADLAVGWNVGQIKTGAPARSERVAKYNRLLRIEEELGDAARYAGLNAFAHLNLSS